MTRAVNNKELIGGRVFQAGPTSVLGVYAPTFTCILELEGLEVRQVSCCIMQYILSLSLSKRNGVLEIKKCIAGECWSCA